MAPTSSLFTGQTFMTEKNIDMIIATETFICTGIACQLNTGDTEKNAPTRVITRRNPRILPANMSMVYSMKDEYMISKAS